MKKNTPWQARVTQKQVSEGLLLVAQLRPHLRRELHFGKEPVDPREVSEGLLLVAPLRLHLGVLAVKAPPSRASSSSQGPFEA